MAPASGPDKQAYSPSKSGDFDGTPHHSPGADGTQPLESGVLMEDFPKRLERLEEAAGLSWRGFAKALGVDPSS